MYASFRSILLIYLFLFFGSCNITNGKSGQNIFHNEFVPNPTGWYSGDVHVHRNCGGDNIVPVENLISDMAINDLTFLPILADMGNGEVRNSEIDLKRVTGKDSPESTANRIVRFEAEWHWDPAWVTFENRALGGHLIFLGLKEAKQIWSESLSHVIDWGREQQAVIGFAHMQHLDGTIQSSLTCCLPVDYPVEAALGTIDFISEDIRGGESTIDAYYKLLNCGIRIGLAAGSDYPCNHILLPYKEHIGTLLTYVNVEGDPTYEKWIDGIKKGKTVISRNRNNEFLDFKVNGIFGPGDEIKDVGETKVSIRLKWLTKKQLFGRVEIIKDGKVIASLPGTSTPEDPLILNVTQEFDKSGWLCARRMDENGHQSHTGAIYITIDNKPVRSSVKDAEFFVSWIENILINISPGNDWNQYYKNEYNSVKQRYYDALNIYKNIVYESSITNN